MGVAYGAKISGIRLISSSPSDADEASALTYKLAINSVYSNSWGPNDDGRTLEGPGLLCSDAFRTGAVMGRGGLGSIYVYASGNGASLGDDCNFDGYANNIYTIPIGAITDQNVIAPYSEGCAALYAVTYSSGGKAMITTSDIKNGCTSAHSGTSAAAPIAAGMIALALSVRPELTWRDVQYLVIHSARAVASDDAGWVVNGAGLRVHHRYGFGNLDAELLVENSKNWTLVPQQFSFTTDTFSPEVKIAQASRMPTTVTFVVEDSNEEIPRKLEHVTVTVTITHPKRGNLVITLTSPQGTTSLLAPPRPYDSSSNGFPGWTFTTVRSWGEDPSGTWTLTIQDVSAATPQGELTSWSMQFYGQNATEQQVVPTPPFTLTPILIAAGLALVAIVLLISCIVWCRWRRADAGRGRHHRVAAADDYDDDDDDDADSLALASASLVAANNKELYEVTYPQDNNNDHAAGDGAVYGNDDAGGGPGAPDDDRQRLNVDSD